MSATELSDAVYARVQDLSEAGNGFMETGRYQYALGQFESALALLPEPKRNWDAATWLHASIGDAQFSLGRFGAARDSFAEARQCPAGLQNPFVLLRLGQCHLELGNRQPAREFLLQAYMLAGAELFEGEEGRRGLDLLRDAGDI